ncbi:SDR family NAD(P)-dependent oxidoreductase [Pedococcus soli]
MPGTGSYAAAKSGVEALTVTTAKEFAAHRVQINAVRPGAIRTPCSRRTCTAHASRSSGSVLTCTTR